jgi:hypothetical protein
MNCLNCMLYGVFENMEICFIQVLKSEMKLFPEILNLFPNAEKLDMDIGLEGMNIHRRNCSARHCSQCSSCICNRK